MLQALKIWAAGVLWIALPAWASSRFDIPCFKIQIEEDDGVLVAHHGERSYLIDEPRDSSQFLNLLDDLTRESVQQSGLGRWTRTAAEKELLELSGPVEKVLGVNQFGVTEQAAVGAMENEIKVRVHRRTEAIELRAKDIKAQNKGMSLENARAEAEVQLAQEKDFVWNEIQLRKAKSDLISFYDDVLSSLGIELRGPVEEIRRMLLKTDPFYVAGMQGHRFPFNRGEALSFQPPKVGAYSQKKFEKHGHEFYPPIESVDEYLLRARALAWSTDPRVISFSGTSVNGPRIIKYDPKTSEMVVLNEKGDFISFYPVNPGPEKNRMKQALGKKYVLH